MAPVIGSVSYSLGMAVAPYTGPGDVVPGATAWWGLRAYTSATIGNATIRLRRDSDQVEQDFTTLASGHLDTGSITTFKGAANLFVVKLYDQVGTNDMTQATAANQPQFILNGFGTNSVMRCVKASSLGLVSLNAIAQAQPYTWSMVAKRTASFTLQNTFIGDLNAEFYFKTADSVAIFAGGPEMVISATDNAMHSVNAVFNGASSLMNVDGSNTTGTTGANSMAAVMNFGTGGSLSNPADADLGGGGVWLSALSGAQCIALHDNQSAFWGF